MTHQTHAYRIVNPSPWPLIGALSALLLTSGIIIWFHFNSKTLLIFLPNALTIYQWLWDIIREGTYQGHHTTIVQKGLCHGIVLFIISEVFFTSGFFWAFFSLQAGPNPRTRWVLTTRMYQPPKPHRSAPLKHISSPSSGISITWSHYSLIEGNRKQIIQAPAITIALGISFTLLQASEYYEASFSTSWWSLQLNLFCCHRISWPTCNYWVNIPSNMPLPSTTLSLYSKHRFGFEAASWYWHS